MRDKKITRAFVYQMIIVLIMVHSTWGLSADDGWKGKVYTVLQSSHISLSDADEITGIFSRADYEDVPYDVLLPRLEEGAAKRVSTDLIITVLERELEAYMAARSIIMYALGEKTAQDVLEPVTPWSRTVTLYLQGANREELTRLLQAFNQQDREDRWNNYRYGCGLYSALLQWGIDREQSLEIVSAVAQSNIPAANYRGILDTLISGTRLRVSPEVMTTRIIRTLSGLGSIEELNNLVLY